VLDQVATRVPSEFIRARLARHPKLRAEMLPDLARRYNELTPAQFRIGKIEGTKHRTSFAIVEKRLCVSWLSDDDWSDPEAREQGVTICKLTLSVQQGRLRQRWTPLANASLHGRWPGASSATTTAPTRRWCDPRTLPMLATTAAVDTEGVLERRINAGDSDTGASSGWSVRTC
jgi:hypothetical protein